MMKGFLKINIFILLLSFLLASSSYALDFAKDNGTDKEGVFIFPKELALRCDIKSDDVAKEKTMSKCLNEVLRLRQGSGIGKDDIREVFNKSYHQMNAAYITLALNKKKIASEYEKEMDKLLGSEAFSAAELANEEANEYEEEMELLGSEAFSAAELAKEEANLKKKQTQIARLSYMVSKNVVDIIDIYTAQLSLEAMRDYGIYEISTDAAPIED